MLKFNVSQLPDDLQYLGEENPPRTEKELFYTPHAQIVSTGICRYTIEINRWRIPITLSLKDIQKLRDRLAIYNWQLIDRMPADSVKVLAAAERFIAGGAK